MIKLAKKKILSLGLALMMLLSIVAVPATSFAKDAFVSDLEEDSYVKAIVNGVSDQDKKYKTVMTYGDTKAEKYNNVVRGNIFIVYPDDIKVDVNSAPITLQAQKDKGFTLNGVTVQPGKSHQFILDMTKENKIIINDQKTLGTDEQWEYIIAGAKKEDRVEVTTAIDVQYPRQWLEGKYNQPGYPTPDPDQNSEKDRIEKAVIGLESLSPETFNVPKGTTAMEVLGKYGHLRDMNITGMENNYVSHMGVGDKPQIGEFDINNFSGWMYTVDEGQGWYFPNVGAGAKSLTKDTEMVWHFTMAYGADIGAPWGAPDGSTGMPLSMKLDPRASVLSTQRAIPVPQWEAAPRFAQELDK